MPQNIAPPGLIFLLAAALAQQPTKPLVLALDGRCGSGKTTLANTLARQFPASITLHTDDFYLPPAQRIRGWEKTPCANMDLDRLRDEALRPAYEASRCSTVPIPAARVRTCRAGAGRAAAGDFGGQLQPPPAADRLRNAAGVPDLRKRRADPPPAGAGGGAICKLCRPVGAAGGGLFCPVPHCGDGRFCGRHHPRRDDLKWLSLRSSHYQRKNYFYL